MYKELDEKAIQFMEAFYDPVMLIENLIPKNFDAPQTWNKDCASFKLYNYQFAMISYESMYATDFTLDSRENFQRKKGAGELYNIAARDLGKSLCGMDLDSSLSLCYYDHGEGCLASYDAGHLKERAERVANIIEGHKFFEIYHLEGQKKTINRGNNFSIRAKTGYKILGVNENIIGKNIGKQYHGKHYYKHWYDEFQESTHVGELKRVDSNHSDGHIERFFGIPELKIDSPLGKILKNKKKRNWICRIPQYVKATWDEKAKKERIEKYGGIHNLSYKLNVEAELIEGASGRFDIERIREQCLNNKVNIKRFEISKDNYSDFDKILKPIDRYPCRQIFIASDIGTTGSPSEIIIIFGEPKSYKYRYNISLFNLTTQEQAKVFKWLYNKLGSAYISLDCTNADGRSIADELKLLGIPETNIIRCSFNENIVIDFEKYDDGRIKINEHGKPLEKKERTIVWACQRLDKLFYNGYLDLPDDDKFFAQFSSYFELDRGGKKSYGSSTEDHLLQSFQCFAIAQWLKEEKEINNRKTKRRILGVIK